MKRHFDLFEQFTTFESLHRAHLLARRGKRDRAEVLRFTQHLEENLLMLQRELLEGTYRTGDYRYFKVYEPKERVVASLPYRDRVVQHALISAVEPLFERTFHHDSYACRPGKGMHAGADRAQQFLRQVERSHGQVYVLKADISKYFNSIDHGVLKRLLRRRIGCERTLAVLEGIIDSNAVIGDLTPKGLPIGNLTSQLAANIYLHELDDFVKHGLRERRYLRYMDDFCVVHHDKAQLHRLRHDVEAFLWDQLRLTTNHKTQVFPISSHRGARPRLPRLQDLAAPPPGPQRLRAAHAQKDEAPAAPLRRGSHRARRGAPRRRQLGRPRLTRRQRAPARRVAQPV